MTDTERSIPGTGPAARRAWQKGLPLALLTLLCMTLFALNSILVPPCPAASRHGSGQLYGHPHDVRRFDALCPAQMAPAASRAGSGLAGAGQLGRGPGAVHLHAGVFHRLCEHAYRGRGPGHRRGRADQHDRLRDPCGAASQPGADAGDRSGHGPGSWSCCCPVWKRRPCRPPA